MPRIRPTIFTTPLNAPTPAYTSKSVSYEVDVENFLTELKDNLNIRDEEKKELIENLNRCSLAFLQTKLKCYPLSKLLTESEKQDIISSFNDVPSLFS